MLVIAPDTTEDRLPALCERIRRVVCATPIRHASQSIRVTGSLGWTAWPDDSLKTLVRRADEALYRAKAEGRDQVVAAQPAA